jgi:hypothetical protein
MKATFVKRSLCECGYAVIREEVPLGKVYDLDLSSIEDGGLICGGCHKDIALKIVMAEDGAGYAGFLPLDIFALKEAHA